MVDDYTRGRDLAGSAADILVGAGRSGGAGPAGGGSFAALMGGGDDGGGGVWGGVKSVIGGTTDVVTAALRVLDVPRGFVASSIKEVGDISRAGESASLGEWIDQAVGRGRDGSIGLGEALPGLLDKPGWAGAAMRFAGDVLTDPLTYVGAPGAAGMARRMGGPRLGRTLAADVIPGTTTPQAALRHLARQGDEKALSFSQQLARAPKGDEATLALGRRAEDWLRAERAGDVAAVEEGIAVLAARGGGAAGIRSDELAETLLGPGTAGLRIRPFWTASGGPQIVSQARWERFTRATRAARGGIAGSAVGQAFGRRWGNEFTSAAKRLLADTPGAATSLRVGLLRAVEESDRAAQLVGRWEADMLGLNLSLAGEVGGDAAKGNAVRTLLETPAAEWDRGPAGEAVRLLGGQVEADRIVGGYRSMFEQVHAFAGDSGLELGRWDNYFPMVMRRNRGRSGGAGGGGVGVAGRLVPSEIGGQPIPVIADAVQAGKAELDEAGRVIRWDQPNWKRLDDEIDRLGREWMGDDWEDLLERDTWKAIDAYVSGVGRAALEARRNQAVLDSGVAATLQGWRDAGRLADVPVGGERDFLDGLNEGARAAARSFEQAEQIKTAGAANRLLEEAVPHPYLDGLAESGADRRARSAHEAVYRSEFYAGVRGQGGTGIADLGAADAAVDLGGLRLSDPLVGSRSAARAAGEHAERLLRRSKTGRPDVRGAAVEGGPMGGLVDRIAAAAADEPGRIAARLMATADRDAAYRAAAATVKRLEAAAARPGRTPPRIVDALEEARAVRDQAAEAVEADEWAQALSPWETGNLEPRGWAVPVEGSRLELPPEPGMQAKILGQWSKDWAGPVSTGRVFASVSGGGPAPPLPLVGDAAAMVGPDGAVRVRISQQTAQAIEQAGGGGIVDLAGGTVVIHADQAEAALAAVTAARAGFVRGSGGLVELDALAGAVRSLPQADQVAARQAVETGEVALPAWAAGESDIVRNAVVNALAKEARRARSYPTAPSGMWDAGGQAERALAEQMREPRGTAPKPGGFLFHGTSNAGWEPHEWMFTSTKPSTANYAAATQEAMLAPMGRHLELVETVGYTSGEPTLHVFRVDEALPPNPQVPDSVGGAARSGELEANEWMLGPGRMEAVTHVEAVPVARLIIHDAVSKGRNMAAIDRLVDPTAEGVAAALRPLSELTDAELDQAVETSASIIRAHRRTTAGRHSTGQPVYEQMREQHYLLRNEQESRRAAVSTAGDAPAIAAVSGPGVTAQPGMESALNRAVRELPSEQGRPIRLAARRYHTAQNALDNPPGLPEWWADELWMGAAPSVRIRGGAGYRQQADALKDARRWLSPDDRKAVKAAEKRVEDAQAAYKTAYDAASPDVRRASHRITERWEDRARETVGEAATPEQIVDEMLARPRQEDLGDPAQALAKQWLDSSAASVPAEMEIAGLYQRARKRLLVHELTDIAGPEGRKLATAAHARAADEMIAAGPDAVAAAHRSRMETRAADAAAEGDRLLREAGIGGDTAARKAVAPSVPQAQAPSAALPVTAAAAPQTAEAVEAGEEAARTAVLEAVQIYTTREAAQAAAAQAGGAPVIDLASGARTVGAGGVAPPVAGAQLVSARQWADRAGLIEAAHAGRAAAANADAALAAVDSPATAGELLSMLDDAADDAASWAATAAAADRHLESVEGALWASGSQTSVAAAEAVGAFRSAYMAGDAQGLTAAAAIGPEASDRVLLANSYLKAARTMDADAAATADRVLTAPVRPIAQRVETAAGQLDNMVRPDSAWRADLRRITVDADPAGAFTRVTQPLAAAGQGLLAAAGDLGRILGADLVPAADAAPHRILSLADRIDEVDLALDAAVATGVDAHARMAQEAGRMIDAAQPAALAKAAADWHTAADRWRVATAEAISAANRARPGPAKTKAWAAHTDRLRESWFRAGDPADPRRAAWEAADDPDGPAAGLLGGWYANAAAQTARDAQQMPRLADRIAERVAGLPDKAPTGRLRDAQTALDDWEDLTGARPRIVAAADSADEAVRTAAVIDILAAEAADRARWSAHLADAEKAVGRGDVESLAASGAQHVAEVQAMARRAEQAFADRRLVSMMRDQAGWKLREHADMMVPEELAYGLQAVAGYNRRNASEAWKALERATSSWRGLAVLSPGFHVRNLGGGWWNNWIAGVRTKDYDAFLGAYRRVMDVKAEGRPLSSTAEAEAWVTEAMERGVIGWGRFKGEVRAASAPGEFLPAGHLGSWNPLAGMAGGPKQNVLVAANREMGGRVEDVLRGTVGYKAYKDALEAGLGEDGAWAAAANAVNRWHFNYSDLSDFERKVKVAVPFWVWMSRNASLQFDLMVHRPQPALNAYRLYEEAGDQAPVNPFAPAYFSRNQYVQVGQTTWFTFEMPWTALARDARSPAAVENVEQLMGMTNPFFKIGVETLTRRDMHRGYELGGVKLLERQLENVIPVYPRLARPLKEHHEGDTRAAITRWASFFGVPLRFLSDDEMVQTLNWELGGQINQLNRAAGTASERAAQARKDAQDARTRARDMARIEATLRAGRAGSSLIPGVGA